MRRYPDPPPTRAPHQHYLVRQDKSGAKVHQAFDRVQDACRMALINSTASAVTGLTWFVLSTERTLADGESVAPVLD